VKLSTYISYKVSEELREAGWNINSRNCAQATRNRATRNVRGYKTSGQVTELASGDTASAKENRRKMRPVLSGHACNCRRMFKEGSPMGGPGKIAKTVAASSDDASVTPYTLSV